MENYQMKILIVDDERLNLDVLSRILKPGFAVRGENDSSEQRGYTQFADTCTEPLHSNYKLYVAKSGKSALKKVEDEKPDLILLDVIMPDMNGFDVLVALKECDTTRNIPVMFITGVDNVESEEWGFALGAVDYITKPFHASIVRARVKTHLRIVEQMRTIEMLGLIDINTNIPNRRSFDNMMITEWGRAIREKKTVSLLMIDIDNFKVFNDKYGHQQGDATLQMVAKVITQTLKRPSDFAARWGGEEFAVILPETDIEGALIVAEAIRANVEASSVPSVQKTSPLEVTISIGVASVTPDIDSMIHEFIKQADMALYAAKEAGRNRVCSHKQNSGGAYNDFRSFK